MLGRVLVDQIAQCESLAVDDGLVGRTFADNLLAEALGKDEAKVARSLQWQGAIHSIGDMLFLGDSCCCEVQACAEVDEQLCLVVKKFQRSSMKSQLHLSMHKACFAKECKQQRV